MTFLSGNRIHTRLGFGTWPLGGEATLAGVNIGYPPLERQAALAAVRRALELGVSFFDTADIYGRGTAEELLGEALAGRRESCIICTKFGNRENADGRRYADFSESWLRQSIEGSLRRLRTDYLDIILLHGPPDDFDWQRFDPVPFDDLVQKGTIRAYGVSSRSVAGAGQVIASGFGRAVEVIYNAMDRRIEFELLPRAAARDVDIIARVPLAKGFLSNRYFHQEPQFDSRDHRQSIAPGEKDWMLRAARSLAFLDELPGGMTVSALRFCLSDPRVSAVIPGMSTAAQVTANFQAMQLGPLPDAVLRRVAEAVRDIYPGWRTA